MSVNKTIKERGNNYGQFNEGAEIMQNLKLTMRETKNWEALPLSHREALEMIQYKIGRILNGNPDYIDNWHDIQGYAKLVEDELVKNESLANAMQLKQDMNEIKSFNTTETEIKKAINHEK